MRGPIDRRVSRRLREIRVAREFYQRDLGYATGLGYNTIIRIEKGRTSPTVRTLENIANILGVEVIEFFQDGEEV